ncbi:MAG: hypothetical protein IGS48_17075 [Oscillatoriales cyanobacterium C42_A2020_001]|nr:hypothetical protein [Leptolyngbyaceae cyanobacterium C42_A2020_001]
MDVSPLKAKVLEEVQRVPENRLEALYDLILHFRLSDEETETNANSVMSYAGCWNDLPDEMFDGFLEDTAQRRQQAFSRRRTHATNDG